ncbi:DUF11 domain-containing protein [Parachlamydia sp. AcF125]|uniref:DUF11 domain-containing protein n=1 Tax=Parachlamydia sp. AcF125 TaxID=2795736 RepID=UPI001BC99AAB|nr:DUF11 domain-containing protein [Parachlamydia sp. AcF125]MBS4168382.1 hypothetical protein [Parachlamydia sp. AcF125]
MRITPLPRRVDPFYFKIIFFTFLFSFFLGSLQATYIKRFEITDNGGMLFTGNTLGLSKQTGKNQPGTSDSIGAFITVDTTQKIGNYPSGTTLEWEKNSSFAFLDLPEGSTVLYAELIWSGSYGFQNEITGNEPDTPITLITPKNASFTITPDSSSSQTATTPGYSNCGNYVRSADVTPYVKEGGGGKYTVGGIPATISALDDTHNAAGWTLAVVYRNGSMLTYNMTLFVGCEQASYETNAPAEVSGFCAPPSGALKGNLFISAIEGDANKSGDHMLFGSSLPLTTENNSLSGTNNPEENFFGSQINTLLPTNQSSALTQLDENGSGLLDTRGSFGNFNADPATGNILSGCRQGYDITSIDISDQLTHDQRSAYALGTTTGDDYTINALGIQIQVGAPTIAATMRVNSEESIEANVGDTVTFTCNFQNNGTSDAIKVIFKDILEDGLEYVPGSFKLNQALQADPDLTVGFPLGELPIGQSGIIEFEALITKYPANGNVFYNLGIIDYQYQTCLDNMFSLEAVTNTVSITLPLLIPDLTVHKQVNAEESIDAWVGETVTFTVNIDSVGPGIARNVILKDPLPSGHTLVPNTVLVNGAPVSSEDLEGGVPIGDMDAGEVSTVSFQATINDYPPTDNAYFYTANIDYQYLATPNEFADLSAISNTVRTNFTPPPSLFTGRVKKCQSLDRKYYSFTAEWQAPNSPDVLFYRIYHQGKIVARVDTHSPLIYKICLKSKKFVHGYEIAAVYPNNKESQRVKVRIVNE